MKLYDYYRSSASYRVRIALNLKQLPYEAIPVHLVNDEQHQPSYLTKNPQGLVPTLETTGHVLHQSLAIIDYLDETHPSPALLPQDPIARAQIRALALTIACDIHPLSNLRVLQRLRKEFKATDDEVKAWILNWLTLGFTAIERQLATLPRHLSVCYGDSITLADICLIPQVFNAHRYGLPMAPYPLIGQINAYCLTLDAFKNASPDVVNFQE